MRERNWLEVYPYTRWGSANQLPVFDVGQRFMPSVLELRAVSPQNASLDTKLALLAQSWQVSVSQLPDVNVGQRFMPSVLELRG